MQDLWHPGYGDLITVIGHCTAATAFLLLDLCNTYIFHIIFMVEYVLKQCLRKEIKVS